MITSVSASFCWKQEMISGCSMTPHPSGTSVSGFCCLYHSSLACEVKLQSRTHRAFIPHIHSVMRFPPTYWLVGLNLRGCPFRTGSNSATSWTSSTKHVRMPPPPHRKWCSRSGCSSSIPVICCRCRICELNLQICASAVHVWHASVAKQPRSIKPVDRRLR